ncbi:MAG: quinol:electron acceptor oxidoreductase subunit ActD [Thermoanaerobaculia bacterium]
MTAMTESTDGIYGILAEYGSAQELLEAVRKARRAGFNAIDAFTPFPVEAISEEVCDHQRSRVP